MTVTYDNYYQTENLFGKPYPELINFFTQYPSRGKVLDLGCGQGRDAIAIARLGFTVIGIDHSKVGIEQMNRIADNENLPLKGNVADIFEYEDFMDYDFIVLDSMFHFTKNDLNKEVAFIKKILTHVKKGCSIIFCIQDTGKKVTILNEAINSVTSFQRIKDKKFEYIFEDQEHKSKTDYRMIIIKKENP